MIVSIFVDAFLLSASVASVVNTELCQTTKPNQKIKNMMTNFEDSDEKTRQRSKSVI